MNTKTITPTMEKLREIINTNPADVFIPKRVIACDDCSKAIDFLEKNNWQYTRNIDTDYGMHYVSTKQQESKLHQIDQSTILYIATYSKRDVMRLTAFLEELGVWWQVRQLNKKRYAYGQEAPGFLKIGHVAKAIAEKIDTTNRERKSAPDDNIFEMLRIAKSVDTGFKSVKPSVLKPVVFSLGAELFDRRNGGKFMINIHHNDHMLAHTSSFYEELKKQYNMNRTYCGTTIPFSLASMMIMIFGRDLQFSGKKLAIVSYLKGKLKISLKDDDYATGLLNAELTRWFTTPDMTYTKFITHCVMFMMPVAVRSS
jgi:hypothetical protein